MRSFNFARWTTAFAVVFVFTFFLSAQDNGTAKKAEGKAEKKKKKKEKVAMTFPPVLPDGKEVFTDTTDLFLKPTETLKSDVAIAKTAPTVDFLYYPGQTYQGNPFSAWGDSLAVNGKYYASIGDHKGPGGNAFVFEYDPDKKTFRQLFDVRSFLKAPEGDYTPGKIHGRLDMGEDGNLYFSTHRGDPKHTATDQYHYKGDNIYRCDPKTGVTEIAVEAPVPKHCIPNSVLDPKRLIFYGGTASGTAKIGQDIQFFAYDLKGKKMLYSGPDGPSRYMILAQSTGRVYFIPGEGVEPLMRFDPEKGGPPVKIDGQIGIRAATQETPQGYVYTVSHGHGKHESHLYSFNTKTEAIEDLGPAPVAREGYIASLDADPTGRYLYYCPGAHGGSQMDGSPLVQFDVKTKQKKVIAFLHPYLKEKCGGTLMGTFSSAVDPKGDKVYVTWNVNRYSEKAWDCSALAVIHIPESERQP